MNHYFIIILCILLVLSLSNRPIESFITTSDNQSAEYSYGTNQTSKIPNIIWTFWEGDKMDIVDKCIESWKYYNPSYKVVILNRSNYQYYIEENIDSIIHAKESMARFSDYIRLCVLAKYGGFWIDASIICHRPFTWIHGIQTELDVELVGYYMDGFTLGEYKDCCPVIENWFFACIPNSIYVTDWKTEFLSTREYNTIDDYLASIKNQDISTQKIGELSNYLAMHVSAQKIMQTNKGKYNIFLFSACNGPFAPLCENGWDSQDAINRLTNAETHELYYKYPIIKLRGAERDIMNANEDMDRAFSNNRI